MTGWDDAAGLLCGVSRLERATVPQRFTGPFPANGTAARYRKNHQLDLRPVLREIVSTKVFARRKATGGKQGDIPVSILDGILGQLGGNVNIADLANKVGLDPTLAERAVAALGTAHSQPGDTVATAASETGIDSGTLSQIVDRIGGGGALAQISQLIEENPQAAGILANFDPDGDGNPLNDVMGLAKSLFGKS